MSVLDTIGRTRLLPFRHIVPAESASILVKLEYENPTGSMKDRMTLAMVEAAEADGRLRPGGSVVEYTGGSTGVSLAFVCAAKRIPLQIVTSPAFSKEKAGPHGGPRPGSSPRRPAATGRISSTTPISFRATSAWARRSWSRPADGSTPSCRASGPAGRCGATSSPTRSRRSRPRTPWRWPGGWPCWRESSPGTSTGGNVAVALRIGERLGPGRPVVTLALDSGMKYLSTELYARA